MSAGDIVDQDKPACSSTGEPAKKELHDMLRDSGLYYELEFVPKGEESTSGAFKGSFPQSLLHFNVKPVESLRTQDLELVSKNGWKSATATFTRFNNPKLGKFFEIISKVESEEARPVMATVSPKFDISLSDNPEEASKGKAGIPRGSKQYAFCAPFQIDWSSIPEEYVPKDAGTDLNFLRYGGYLYFGGDGQLLDMTALNPQVGGSFRFRPPKKFALECAALLKEADRLSPITTKGFPGAGYFAWVGHGDQGMPGTPHGAFVFLALDADIPALNPRMMLATNSLYFQLRGTSGWDFKFGAPQQMWPEWVAKLEEQGRWFKVTVPAMRKAGADRFAWLRPSKDEPDLIGFASEDGAFCYIR